MHAKSFKLVARFLKGLLTSTFLILTFAYASHACTCDTKGKNCDYSGDILISVEDYPDGTTKTKYKLRRHDSGQIFDLEFKGSIPNNLKPGMKIKVHGAVTNRKKTFNVAADSTGKSRLTITSTTDNVAGVTGTKSLAVIVISSSDYTQTVTDAQIDSVFWSGSQNISGLYNASSYGNMSFSKAGIFRTTLPYATSAACNYSQYSADARTQLGTISANYFVYILPTTSCGWAGVGSLCSGSAWIPANYALYGDVNSHELGHNICMHHAAIDPTNNGTNQGEYNDTSCIMGYGGVGWRYFNAVHIDQQNWLPAGRRIDVSSSTTRTITALETDPLSTSLPYLLRLPRTTGDYYYISHRKALGNYSSGLRNSGSVSIHRASASPGYSYLITNLAVGQSWTDTINGATITFAGSDATTANVQVSYGCVVNAPTISIQPATQYSNASSATKTYAVTVTNKDSVGCASSVFSLAGTLPSGFSGTFDSSTLTLAGGASATTNLVLSTPSNPTDGTYSFNASATEASHTSATANGQIVIDRTAPPLPSAVASYTNKGRNKGDTITITNSSPDLLSGFAGNSVYKNGVKLNSSLITTGTFKDSSGLRGTVYTVTATDKAGNESAAISVVAN